MVYCDFSNSLYKYLDIYHNGLKKLANKEMQAIVGHLREMSDENQDEILTQFLSDYCDSDVWDTLKDRGNADIKRVYPNVDYTTLRREENARMQMVL